MSSYVVTLQQVVDNSQPLGFDVVATGTGAIDLTNLTFGGNGLFPESFIDPATASIITGHLPTTSLGFEVNFYGGPISGPSSFGSGSSSFADFPIFSIPTGDLVGFLPGFETLDPVAVPFGYISDTPLSDSATYLNATFASLGLTPGIYKWTWGTGADQSFTLEIGAINPTVVADHNHVTAGLSVTEDAAHGVLANDTDPIPNDSLTVSAVNGNPANVGLPVQGLYGALTLNSDGGYSYDANGSSLPGDGVGFDTFAYTAKDGGGGTASTDLTVVVVSPTEHYLGGTAGTTINGANFQFGGQVLDGSLGNDVLLPGKSGAVEIGGPNDILTGNLKAADKFVFHDSYGSNEITNFSKNDSIWLDHTTLTSFNQLMHDATQSGTSVVINDNAGNVIQLDHMQLAALHSSNFHFIV